MNNKRSQQRLGRILHWLAWVLGVAELGIMSRAGEWLGYEQIGTLGFVYFLALMAGVVIGPRLPMHTANVVGLSVLLAALPIVGIGLLVQGVIAPKAMFTTVCVLWAASGAGAGMLDNAQSSAAVNYSPRGGTSSVAMLGTRHLGTLSASAATAVAVTYGIDVGWHYVALGAILIVPFLGRRAVPDVHRTDVGVAAPGGRSVSAWVLFPMGLYLTASVLPISASWAWINPIMRELHAPDILSASALSVFVVAQAIASFVYYRRSLKHSASRLVRGGLVVSAVGVVALVLVVTHGKVQILPAEWLNYVAWGAFALIGWGVAPLPMVVAQAANRLPMKLRITSRISRMVALQCLLVAAGNYALGRLAELWTGAQAYAAMSVMCVVILFLGIRITSRRS